MKEKIVSIIMVILGSTIIIYDFGIIDYKKEAIKASLNPVKGQLNKGGSLWFLLGLFILGLGILSFSDRNSGNVDELKVDKKETEE